MNQEHGRDERVCAVTGPQCDRRWISPLDLGLGRGLYMKTTPYLAVEQGGGFTAYQRTPSAEKRNSSPLGMLAHSRTLQVKGHGPDVPIFKYLNALA